MKNEKIKCTKCGEEKTLSTQHFFKSYSPLHSSTGFVPTCKECIKDIYNDFLKQGKSEKASLIELCKMLDKPFIDEVYCNILAKTSDNHFTDLYIGAFFKQVHMSQWRKRNICRYENSIFSGQTKEEINEEQNNKEEVKIYSKKWRGDYTKSELEYLDEYLAGLDNDFKIITTNHKDYAKKIAQASLAVDKAYKAMLNGEAGADKRYDNLQKTFDTLSKSAQFSENTRTANDTGINGIAQIVDKVETKQWIYESEEIPKDALDHLLEQFSNIKKSI